MPSSQKPLAMKQQVCFKRPQEAQISHTSCLALQHAGGQDWLQASRFIGLPGQCHELQLE
ncbi:hypothetical protein AFCA_002591 [Aspergillus flavus]|nr:hypothetical protein AFCA_002591 [Aspergillus flavus]